MLFLVFFLTCIATYLICGIPFGKIFASLGGIDITQHGSKNIGMTNVTRVCGIHQGILTLVADMLKAYVALSISYFCLTTVSAELIYQASIDWMCSWLYLVAIIGHIFSPYLRLKGGKGIAVGFGGALAYFPLIACGLLIVWLIALLCSRYVSLASIAAAFSLPWFALSVYWPPSIPFILPFFLASILVIWSHRTNITRLKNGTESRIAKNRRKKLHE